MAGRAGTSSPETWDAFFSDFYLRAYAADEREGEAEAQARAAAPPPPRRLPRGRRAARRPVRVRAPLGPARARRLPRERRRPLGRAAGGAPPPRGRRALAEVGGARLP